MTALTVTEDEKAKYTAFINGELAKTSRPPPAELYHYTSGEGLVGIIKSGDLWATHASCLNDAAELRHATRLIREWFQLYRQPRLKPDTAFICDRAITELSVDRAPTSEWFVACLSEEADDLSQWRAYGRGEGGYAIGFNVAELGYAVVPTGSQLVPVCYDSAVHHGIGGSVVKEIVRLFGEGLATRPGVNPEVWADAFLPEWQQRLSYLAPIIKHHKFAAEKEWRIVRELREEDFCNLKFRQRQSMLARHLPLALRFPETSTAPLLPISSVRVGPSRHQEISKVGVADLLRGQGYPKAVYDNYVRVSEVPFQAF
jgi:hypothetical protein